jgi:hypothetical protein
MDDSCSMTSIPLVSLTSSKTPISYRGILLGYSFQLKGFSATSFTGDSYGVSYKVLIFANFSFKTTFG